MKRRTFLLVIDFKPRLRRTFETWLLQTAAVLRERGIDFHVAVSDTPVEWFPGEFAEQGGTLHVLPSLRGRFDKKAVRELLQRVRPQGLSFCFFAMLSAQLLLLTRFPGVHGTVFIDQSSTPIPQRRGWKQLLIRLRGALGGRCFCQIVTVSDYNRSKLIERLGLPGRRIQRIYNGIDLSRFETPPAHIAEDAPFLYVGQMEEYKGVQTLIKAYKELRSRQPGCPSLHLAGGGKLLEPIRKQVAEEGLSGAIHVLGLRNDAPLLMMSARAILIPSQWEEACAFVAIEAMASGRPVIISDAGSLPELFAGQALVFPKGNAAELSRVLESILEPSLAARQQGCARIMRERAFQEFSLRKMVSQYTPVFEGACGS